MTGVTTLLICAVIVQFVTERFKFIILEQWKPWAVPLIATVIGVAIAYATQIGLLDVLEIKSCNEHIDYVLTGIAYSGGSAALNELIKSVMERRPSNSTEKNENGE